MPVLLGLVAFPGRSTASEAPLPAGAAYAIAALAFVGAIVLSFRVGTQPTMRELQTAMIVCLAVAESGSFIGFVLVGMNSPAGYVPFVVGNLAVNVLFLLPRVLAALRAQGRAISCALLHRFSR